MVAMLSSGMLTFLTFCVLGVLVVLGFLSLRKHIARASAPWESELTEAGREAQKFEHPGI